MTGIIALLKQSNSTNPQFSAIHVPDRGPQPTGVTESLVMTSLGFEPGEGLPASTSLQNVTGQLAVTERWADGSPKSAMAIAPIDMLLYPESIPGEASEFGWDETVAGSPSALAGNLGVVDLTQMTVNLTTQTRGVYQASPATATNTKIIVGSGSELGSSGPDYLRITRYFCPFLSQAGHTGIHAQCGALIVYATERADHDGVKIDMRFASGIELADMGPANGSWTPSTKNPGHIKFESLGHPIIPGFARVAMDTGGIFSEFPVDGGASNNFAISPFENSMPHDLPQGMAPGFKYVFYPGGAGTTARQRAIYIMESKDFSFAWSGRGMFTDSNYGFGANNFRYVRPEDMDIDNFPNTYEGMEARAEFEVNDIKGHIADGTSSVNGRDREGWCFSYVFRDPNNAGGGGINGHCVYMPTRTGVSWMAHLNMCDTRRSTHDFYIADGERQHSWFDHMGQQTDSDGTHACTYYTVRERLDYPAASYQFNYLSPNSGRPLYPFSSNNPELTPRLAPTDRDWNTGVQNTSSEDPTNTGSRQGPGSYNIAHSSRMMGARDGFLFGLDMLGYDLMMGFGALCAAYHTPVETDQTDSQLRGVRESHVLHLWGWKDTGMTWDAEPLIGHGNMMVRAKDSSNNIGPKALLSGDNTTVFNPEDDIFRGAKYIGFPPLTRVFGWSLVWQSSAYLCGGNAMRSGMRGQTVTGAAAGAVHDPFQLVADMAGHWAGINGVITPFYTPNSGNSNFKDVWNQEPFKGDPNPTDMETRLGGQPFYGTDAGSASPQYNLDGTPDPEEWGVNADFHQYFVAFACDAVHGILSSEGRATEADQMLPILQNFYWTLITFSQAPRADGIDRVPDGTMPTQKNPTMNRGVNGRGNLTGKESSRLGSMPSGAILANWPPTEQEMRQGDLWWIQEAWRDSEFATTISYMQGFTNTAMGMITSLRYLPADRRAECLSLYGEAQGIGPDASLEQLLEHMRTGGGDPAASNGHIDYNFMSSTRSRIWPVLGEARRLFAAGPGGGGNTVPFAQNDSFDLSGENDGDDPDDPLFTAFQVETATEAPGPSTI